MLVAPHLHHHDLSFLLIPTLTLCFTLVDTKTISPLQAALVLLTESVYMAVINITPARFVGIYVLMLALVLANRYAGRFRNLPSP